MAVITINGQTGSGGIEVGIQVARLLDYDYVDRLILAEAARRIGATMEAVAEKEQRTARLKDRIARFIQLFLERSALSSGEAYFGPGVETLLARDYTQLAQEPITEAQQLDDKRFIEVTRAVILDLARSGNVVISGRGSNIVLRDMEGVLHIGMVAPLEVRIRRIMGREGLGWKEAERFTIEMEKGRIAYFKRFFRVHPDDPTLYHIVMNMGRLDVGTAARLIVQAVSNIGGKK